MKDRQHNGQKKKDKGTNNDLQNTTQKTKGRATHTSLKTGGELRCSGRVGSSCFTSNICRATQGAHASCPFGKEREAKLCFCFPHLPPHTHTYFGKNLEKAKFVAWMQNKFSTIL
jgi:hypothetical protein